jgi:hypothetical protein
MTAMLAIPQPTSLRYKKARWTSTAQRETPSSPTVLLFPALEESISPSIIEMPEEERILSELLNLFHEYSETGWDGYHAKPISIISLNYALKFTTLLRVEGFSLPNFIPDPTGKIAMIWETNSSETIISINNSGDIIFSKLFDAKGQLFGVTKFLNQIPHEIKTLLSSK